MFDNLPSPTVVISSSSQWSNAFLSDWMIFVYIGVGVLVAFMFIRFLINTFIGGVSRLTQSRYGDGSEFDELRALHKMYDRKYRNFDPND